MAFAMSTLRDFHVGVLDFFGALLPGAVTLGVAVFLDVPLGLPSEIMSRQYQSSIVIASFCVASYVVGQMANAVGSIVLDWIYDLLYAPGKGWWSRPEKPAKTEGRPSLPQHAGQTLLGFLEHGAGERATELENALKDATKSSAEIRGVYQTTRAYLRVSMPDAFSEVEKLEGDQKFFRALTVGLAALTVSLAWLPAASARNATRWCVTLLLLTFLAMTRYLLVRRKTVERAYLYLSVRNAPARSSEPATAPHT